MRGKIIKGIGGFYYVDTEESGVFACRARGIFRKEKKKPLVGDDVEISVLDETDREGSLDEIFPRRNELIRPASANIDQALVIFAADYPKPNFNLLDRFLISMQQQDIPVIICFNKSELVSGETLSEYCGIYEKSGCRLCTMSIYEQQGLEEVKSLLIGKTTCIAGPSGVGKSSLTNYLHPQQTAQVGELSKKIGRGKQTTRHTELFRIERDSYFLDTPGFTSLYVTGLEPEDVRWYYAEFEQFRDRCRFQGCMHLSEPDCAVKAAVAEGKIHRERYENYRLITEEVKQSRRY
ncbi:MAG: ribosome small subunit-dependent GTPase A [Lachnospiraceae bacterium]|nr:ribosome small subunit-dependent GTPase A [Lachnospiraceae bacterium]